MNIATKRLGDLADVFNGKTPSKSEQRENGHPVLKIKDVSEFGEYRGQFESFVEKNLAEKHASRWIKSGDSLILNAAHNAEYVASKIFLCTREVEGSLPTGEWLLVRPNQKELIPEYFHYWLKSNQARKDIRFIVKGIHLYPKDVAKLIVPCPQISEQRRIIEILSHAESIVRLRRAAKEKAKAIIPALFLDIFGEPTRNPKGWPIKTLGELVSMISGGTPSKAHSEYWNGTLPWVSPKDMKTPDIFDSIDHIHNKVLRETNIKLVPLGAILIVVRGMILVHTVPVARAMVPITINQDMKAMVPCSEISSFYLLWALRVLQPHLLELVTTAAHGTRKLDTARLESLRLPVPPLSKQQFFEFRGEEIISFQFKQELAAAKAQATFDALLSGSWDVCSLGKRGSK